ncbi:MAG: MATE family efflux transporter [Prevotella sp.]|nr:MATE family efflux transporter [Prevotella sp.]
MKDKLLGEDGRTSLIKKNVLASFFIKAWTALVQLLLVPLTLSCLGVYENGVWLTIGSVLLWIDNLDIGLGNGLRNKLAVYMARNDINKAREMVSSTLAMLVIIIIPSAILMIVGELFADNYQLLNVDPSKVPQLDIILLVTTILVCNTFVFKFLGNFYMGLQLPAVNNLLGCLGNTLILLGTFIVYKNGYHSMLLIALINTGAPLFIYLICYPITFMGKYKMLSPSLRFVTVSAIRELFSLGVKFFLLQIPAIILFFTSNILISHLFSPSMVTPYQIAHRYFTVTMTLFTIICVPYWTATTDAYERKDFSWIRKANKTLNKIMLLILVIIAVMTVFSDSVYHIWIQGKAYVPFSITLISAVYQFIILLSMRYSFVLNGIGALHLQLVFTIIASVIFLPLAVCVGKTTHDINDLLMVMCLVHLPGLIVNYIQYHKIVNGKATGIWIK